VPDDRPGAEDVVMVGDDVISDVGGAQAAGIRGVLVRSGKYTPADEIQTAVRPTLVLDNLAALVDIILA
jgi:phospholysine phosphohistidine inorganic pyrophosphate phosphatase